MFRRFSVNLQRKEYTHNNVHKYDDKQEEYTDRRAVCPQEG